MLNKDNFESYTLACKVFEEGKPSSELSQKDITFNAAELELSDLHNTEIINEEMNRISRKIFRYSVILEMQAHVLQLMEDEFDMWHSKRYLEVSAEHATDKKAPTNVLLDSILSTRWESEYSSFKSTMRTEQYKHNLLKRTVSALEGYSYKLHDLQDYRKAAMMKGM